MCTFMRVRDYDPRTVMSLYSESFINTDNELHFKECTVSTRCTVVGTVV